MSDEPTPLQADRERIRLACLRLAIKDQKLGGVHTAAETVARAQAFADFVLSETRHD